MKKKLLAVFLCFSILAIYNLAQAQSDPQQDALASHIDSTVNPGNDFFEFANGKWFKNHPIPPSEQYNGIFQLIQDTINTQIKEICVKAAALENPKKGSNKQKIGDFYASGMDSAAINMQKYAALKPELDRIDAIRSKDDLVDEVARIQVISGSPMFRFYVGQDDKISSKNAIFLSQGGLSLPDRSYYFATDQRAKKVRSEFQKYAASMYRILGQSAAGAQKNAETLMKLETNIAKTSRKREDTRDPHKNYNKMTVSRLQEMTPNINWKHFFESAGLSRVDTVIVGQPEFFTALDGYVDSYSMDTWKNYLKLHLISRLAPYLDDHTYQTYFDFYSKTLRGVQEPRPRWKRVVNTTNRSLGDLIGQVYVDEYLPKGTKAKLMEIGKAIRDVYAERIENLDWMSEPTKKKALYKLDHMIFKVGYPDKWKDLSSMQIDRSSYVQNVMNANEWEFDRMIHKYGQPVDRTEWHMEPQTWNAYYNPSNNEIVMPGCIIIVPGYEHKLADDAILYSAIGGSFFGHEITHGFDDQGSKYDAKGNLNNWWTSQDSTRFYAKTRMIVKQYSNYVAVDSLHINGESTQGENIADLGGIMMGYQAFQQTDQYKEGKKIAGLTPDQRFFLGYALAWMIQERPEAIANQVRSDVHSPAKFRVNGPLSDMPQFYEAFDVKKGDAMWRPDSERVKIW
ncbi:MAG TPA: M13 family metallopeptidase [Balneolaceae bacterium]|nr:M13 family metallopeptidase [Balneolaceae bacterium]